jgi:N-acetylmuramoyl-L-alanine amidase
MGKRLRREMSDGDPDWESDFTVIKKANMPALLTENFFYTDPDDCKYINTERGIEEIAIVHADGIAKFAQKKYNMGYKDLTKK